MCVFFFFKQKTAYEMRISDWSSDVCSSDLASVRPEDMALRDYMVVLAAALVSSAVGAAEPAAKLSPVMSGTVHQALFSISLDGKIGRASCRERVCQYE